MPRKQYQYHYIYKTTNIINNNFYIGMHSTNVLDDGYQGSGKRLWRSINKHGKENHQTEILEFLPNREALKNRESEIVNKKLLNEKLCMNLTTGGQGINGSWKYANDPKYNNPTHSLEHMKMMSKKGLIARKEKIEYLIKNDPEWRAKRFKAQSAGQTKSYKNGRIGSFAGKRHTNETKKKIGEKNSIKQSGEKNSQYGTCWIYNSELKQNKKIKLTELDIWLSKNWYKGRKFFKKL